MRIFRKITPSPDLATRGVRRHATVKEAKLLNRGEFQLSGTRAEQLFTGEATMTTMRLVLDVEGRDKPVTCKVPVPTMLFTKVAVGTWLTVLVDPDDDRRLEIDWDGEIVEPSLEERAEHDPMLGSILDRRIDPPESP